MITLARESRGYQQQELAKHLGISQGSMSKIEQHAQLIGLDTFRKLARTLKYPETFFYQQGETIPTVLSYRRHDQVAAPILTYIEAMINVRRMVIERLTSELQIPPTKLPVIAVTKKNSPEEIARSVRKFLGARQGPMPHLVHLLERLKVFIVKADFGTPAVLSRTILSNNRVPIVFVNERLLGDQLRFTLAYELGHLVMHAFAEVSSSREIGHESNLFAAELLMPRSEIKGDLKNKLIDIPRLGELKKKWGVSMQSLLYRANDVGIISENRKNFLLGQFKKSGIKKREPVEFDIPVESSKYLSETIARYQQEKELSRNDLLKRLGLNEGDLESLLNSTPSMVDCPHQ